MKSIPNATNGLPLVAKPWDHVLYFQSCHGEHKSSGYFDATAVPLGFIIDLLRGESYRVVDGTRDGKAPRAFLHGMTTFALVWERARTSRNDLHVTASNLPAFKDCMDVAMSDRHEALIATIRKFSRRICIGKMPALSLTFRDGRSLVPEAKDAPGICLGLTWERAEYDDNVSRTRAALGIVG